MIKVGLTGNIGSGKTLVVRIFSVLRIPLYRADVEAKRFFQDEAVKTMIIKEIGHEVLGEDNAISTRKLGQIVFNNPAALQTLNGLIHPLVRDDLKKWLLTKHHEPYIIFESAILFESDFYKDFDKIITVAAPQELRIQRVMARDGISRQEVIDRIKNQWSDEEKIKRADFVVYNDEERLVVPQILSIHRKLIGETGHDK
jgi:dephospho-CoA kinase